MLKFKILTPGFECTIALPVNEPEEVANYEIIGNPPLLGTLEEIIESQYGEGGHTISNPVSALDLLMAVKSLDKKGFNTEVVEGEAIAKAAESISLGGDVSTNYALEADD